MVSKVTGFKTEERTLPNLGRLYERGLLTVDDVVREMAMWADEQYELLAAAEATTEARLRVRDSFSCPWCRGDGRGDHAADCAKREIHPLDPQVRLGHCTPRWGGHSLACDRDGRFCSKDSSHEGPCTPHGRPRPASESAGAGLIRFTRPVGPCPCECNSGGFCGGCGHAGCSGGINLRGR